VYSRRQFCADIQVCSPQELLWNPRLREAATTLCDTLRTEQCKNEQNDRKKERPIAQYLKVINVSI